MITHIINSLAWPVTILIIITIFRKDIKSLFSRTISAKINSKGVEFILNEMENKGQLPFGSRSELSGLTGHDIWALNDFAIKKINPNVSEMNAPQQVMARTLIDSKLLSIEGEGNDRNVKITALGTQMLEAANKLLK